MQPSRDHCLLAADYVKNEVYIVHTFFSYLTTYLHQRNYIVGGLSGITNVYSLPRICMGCPNAYSTGIKI